jgi:hypothetical protein
MPELQLMGPSATPEAVTMTVAVGECEDILGMEFLKYLPSREPVVA